MDFMNTILRFFQDGGAFMYPISLVLVIGLAIAIERWVYLTHAKISNRRAFDRILPLLAKGWSLRRTTKTVRRFKRLRMARQTQSPWSKRNARSHGPSQRTSRLT